MRISKPWSEFDKALTLPKPDEEGVLHSAALKRKAELELEFEIELDDKIVMEMLAKARKSSRHSSSGMLRCIRRWEMEIEEDDGEDKK